MRSAFFTHTKQPIPPLPEQGTPTQARFTDSQHKHSSPTALKPSFGRGSTEFFLPASEKLYSLFNKSFFANGGQRLNLSVEDWASRSLTLIAINIPYTIRTLKDHVEFWETNVRNYATWIATIALLSVTKNERFSINTWLNAIFMVPKLDKSKPNQRADWIKDTNAALKTEILDKYKNEFNTFDRQEIKHTLDKIRDALKKFAGNPGRELNYDDLFKDKPFLKALGIEHADYKNLSRDNIGKIRRDYRKLRRKGLKTIRGAHKEWRAANRKLDRLAGLQQFELDQKTLPIAEQRKIRFRLKSLYYGIRKFMDEKVLDRFRMTKYYIKVLEENGFKPFKLSERRSAAWAGLDGNQINTISNTLQTLREKTKQSGAKLAQHETNFLEVAPKFLRRLNIIKATATIAYGLLGAYLMGTLIMRFVFKYVVPIDQGQSIKKTLGLAPTTSSIVSKPPAKPVPSFQTKPNMPFALQPPSDIYQRQTSIPQAQGGMP